MGIFKRVMDALRGRKEERPKTGVVYSKDGSIEQVISNIDFGKEVEPYEGIDAANAAFRASMISTSDAAKAMGINLAPDPVAWYEGQDHFEINRNKKGLVINITPAGWVHVMQRWIAARQEALKYCRHSKRRDQIKKRIKNGNEVLDVCINERVGVPEAFNILRGR